MARPLWTGTLSFGFVTVPVRLYSAVAQKEVHFHLLHDADGARIRMKRVCEQEGREVPAEHVVKGYEYRRGRYVQVTAGELDAFDPRATRTIDVQEFVDPASVDAFLFDTHYHLVPAKGAERAFGLVRAALERTGRAGVGRFVFRTRGHLCLVRPHGRALALTTLHWADELVDPAALPELKYVGERPEGRELQAAEELVGALTRDFDPRAYRDEHRERLLDFLERRARGARDEPSTTQAPEATETADLLAALQRSVEALRRGGVEVFATPEKGAVRVPQLRAARTVRTPGAGLARATRKGGSKAGARKGGAAGAGKTGVAGAGKAGVAGARKTAARRRR